MTREERIRRIREECWREAKANEVQKIEAMSRTSPAWIKGRERSW